MDTTTTRTTTALSHRSGGDLSSFSSDSILRSSTIDYNNNNNNNNDDGTAVDPEDPAQFDSLLDRQRQRQLLAHSNSSSFPSLPPLSGHSQQSVLSAALPSATSAFKSSYSIVGGGVGKSKSNMNEDPLKSAAFTFSGVRRLYKKGISSKKGWWCWWW